MDILISGVGGQGNVLASKLIATSVLLSGMDVKTSESIGMAQRGGSVVSHIRIGDDKNSPIIPESSGDLLIGLELSETIRNIDKMKQNSKMIINVNSILPSGGKINNNGYKHQKVVEYINSMENVITLDATSIAKELGNIRVLNVVMIGAAYGAGLLPISKQILEKVIYSSIPEKYRQLNIKAFNAGIKSTEKYRYINTKAFDMGIKSIA